MEKMGKLIDLEMDDDDALDHAIPMPGGERHVPHYPYGMRVSMDKPTLEKLGLHDDLAKGAIAVGDTIHLRSLAKVTHISHDEQSGHRMEMQITHVFEPVEDEDKE